MALARKGPNLSTALQAAAIVVVTFAAFFPTLGNGLIWDDNRYIEQNNNLRTLRGLAEIWLKPISAEPQYYPLTHTTLWIEYHLWSLHPLGYHLDNILLQAISALLLWRILLRLRIPGALVAAMVFAVHPVQVESVAWATERKNVLSGTLYLLSLTAYLRTRWGKRIWQQEAGAMPAEAPRKDLPIGVGWYAASLLLFFAALLSKTVAASLPAAILILLWWRRGTIRGRDVYPLLPMFVAGAAMGSLTGWMEKYVVGAIGPNFGFLTPLDRACIAGRAIWFYLAKLLLPVRLTFIYPHWNVDPLARPWWLAFPASAAGLLLALWLLRSRLGRGPAAALIFFLVTLFPALGFANVFPMQFSYVADHFQYLACIGPVVLFVGALARLRGKWGWPVSAVLVAGLAIASNVRTRAYADRMTLWRDTLAKNPDSPMAHNNLGVELMNAGDTNAARQQFYEAARLRAQDTDYVGLGQAAAIDGNYREALGFYLKALDALPKVNEAVFQKLRAGREFQIGTAYQGLAGEFPGEASRYLAAAEQAYRKAIELYPEYEDPRLNLAAILIGEGRLAEAIDQCTFVIQRNPQSVSAHINLGNAYYARHQFDAAMTAYRKALDLDPQNAGAMASIAAILAQSGHVDEAISLLHQALKIDPNNALARRNLAAAMAISAQTRP